MATKLAPKIEHLESREVLANSPFGFAWADPQNLSVSFASDSTKIGGDDNGLFAHLSRNFSTQQAWQTELLKAYQTWVSVSNINVHIKNDSNSEFGSRGSPQNDPRFGDLRIGAIGVGNSVLGTSTPWHPTAGTWAGDTVLNTHFNFGKGASTSYYDLYTVMLQESGHALGIGNSPNRGSVMFEQYLGMRAGLAPEDVRSIQALYGARRADDYEGQSGNETAAVAATLRLPQNQDRVLLDGDLTTATDVDFYELKGLDGRNGNITIKLHTSSLSLLVPRFTLYENDTVLGTVSAVEPGGGDLKLRITNLHQGSKYYIKVSSDPSNAFNVGAYRIKVYDGSGGDDGDGSGFVSERDNGTNETLLSASNLSQSSYTSEPGYAFGVHGVIEQSNDVDVYRLRSPSVQSGRSMLVMVWGENRSKLNPTIRVYDSNRQEVPSDVIVNEDGSYVVQVNNVNSRENYLIRIAAYDAGSGNNAVGDYFLGVQFRDQGIRLDTASSATLTAAAKTNAVDLIARQGQLFHFVLSASAASTAAFVQLTVTDASGQVIAKIDADAGESTSMKLYVKPGRYRFSVTLKDRNGQPLPSLAYKLRFQALSDPIGPQESDPLGPPPAPSGNPLPPFEWTPPSTDL